MSYDIGDNRNIVLKLKSKLGLYQVVLTTPKTSTEKLTLTVVEKQQMPHIERTDSKEELSRLEWKKYSGRRKVCVNFQVDADKLNIVVHRYQNSLYFKDIGVYLKTSNRRPVTSGQMNFSFELHWHILQAVQCTGWNNCS